MLKKTLPIILHPRFIKLASIIIGYMLWFFIAQHQFVSRSLIVPICFYGNEDSTIVAPQQAVITISGNRTDIGQFNPAENGFHIDMTNYNAGTYNMPLLKENLFLPDSIKLVQLIPSNISINIDTKETKND